MKRLLPIALALTIILGGSSSIFAQENTETKFCEDPQVKAILQEMMDETNENQVDEENIEEPILMRGPAPALTYVQTYMVKSSNGGEEILEKNQTATKNDHGGGDMQISTIQLGFSNSKFAKIGGSEILGLVKSEVIDVNGDRIGDGMLYVWNAHRYEDGVFTYQATSANAPWNTMSTPQLFIR